MLEDKVFDTGTVTVSYGEGPPAGPPLVLLHGAGGTWHSFLTVVPELIGKWHVYAVTHRGHGQSGRVTGCYRAMDYIKDATGFLRDLVGEPAYLWGQSLGANVSIGVTAQAPELVRAVVLEEPGIEKGPGKYTDMIRQMRDIAASGLSAEGVIPLVADLTVEIPGLNEPVRMGDVRGASYLRLTAETLSQLEPEVLTFILDGRVMEGYDVDVLLPQVACPALFLKGEAAFGGLEDEVAQRAAGLLPRGQLVKVPGAGHNVHQTQPEGALEASVSFLGAVVEQYRQA